MPKRNRQQSDEHERLERERRAAAIHAQIDDLVAASREGSPDGADSPDGANPDRGVSEPSLLRDVRPGRQPPRAKRPKPPPD